MINYKKSKLDRKTKQYHALKLKLDKVYDEYQKALKEYISS